MGWSDWAYNAISGTTSLVTNTLGYALKEVAALPGYGYSFLFNREKASASVSVSSNSQANLNTASGMQRVASQLGKIMVYDLVPLVAVPAFYNYLTYYLTPSDESESPEESMLKAYGSMVLMLGLSVTNGVLRFWTMKKKAETIVHTTLALTGATGAFEQASKHLHPDSFKDVCKVKPCGAKRIIKRFTAEQLTYLLEMATIEAVGLIPYLGGIAKFILYALSNGRLMVGTKLASQGVCGLHRTQYLREYVELSLALGLSQETMLYLLANAIERYTNVERSAFMPGLRSLFVTIFTGLHYHMKDLPEPVLESERLAIDPFHHMNRAIAGGLPHTWAFLNGGVKGVLKIKSEEPFPFEKCKTIYLAFVTHPVTQTVYMIALPSMFHGVEQGDFQNFVNDVIVRDYWPGIQEAIIDVVDNIEQVKENMWVQWGAWMVEFMHLKKPLSFVLKKTNSVPPFLTKLAIELANSESFVENLQQFKQEVVALQVNDDDSCIANYGWFNPLSKLLGKQTEPKKIAILSLDEHGYSDVDKKNETSPSPLKGGLKITEYPDIDEQFQYTDDVDDTYDIHDDDLSGGVELSDREDGDKSTTEAGGGGLVIREYPY